MKIELAYFIVYKNAFSCCVYIDHSPNFIQLARYRGAHKSCSSRKYAHNNYISVLHNHGG